MDFGAVIAQEETKARLLAMWRADKVPHALMLHGPQGAGKLPLALAMASLLLCRSPREGRPCGQCPGCRMVDAWSHPDLHFAFPVFKCKSADRPTSDDFLPQWRAQLAKSAYFDTEDWLADIKADNQQPRIYVEESDALQRKLALRPNQGGRRAVVIWLPERMMEATANKLLKLIEEPPPGTHFLLVSQSPEQVLGTIQSRAQPVRVPALGEADIASALRRLHGAGEAEAASAAHIAQGSYTAALKRLTARDEESAFFELFTRLMRHSYARRIKDMRQWAAEAAELGRERQRRLLDYCQRLTRENFIHNFHSPEMSYQTSREEEFSERFAPFVNERNVAGIMGELSDAARDIEQNANPRMVFFDLALKMIVLLKQ